MVRSCLFLLVLPLFAQNVFAQDAEIQAILKNTESAWNRGDLATVASYYEDSPQTTFIGKQVTRGGTKNILERYQRAYPTPEARGTLTFSEIEIRTLADGVALAIGKFSLQRTAAGGGNAEGRFTLVLHRTPGGWKIIHDHSS